MPDATHEALPVDQETAALKLPPHSLEAEQSVLGGLMLDNPAWDHISDHLAADDFYRYEHRLIFNVMAHLAEAGQPLDVVTLSEALEARDQLSAVGGLGFLAELARNTPSASNIRAYAEIVRERATLRKLIRAANQIADGAFASQGRPADELLNEAERLVFQIAEERPKTGGPIGMSDLLTKAVDRIDELFNLKGEMTGLPSGFRDFDEMTTGLQPSDLVIIAGRPSMGKCIMAGSRLVDPDSGALVTIDELVERKQAGLLTLSDNFTLTPSCASAFVDDGQKPVFKVRTALGREIATTLTHPFLTAGGWKPLGDMAVGDRVAVPRSLPVFGQESMPEHEVIQLANQVEKEGGLQSRLPPAVFRLPRHQLALFLNCLFAGNGSAYLQTSDQPLPSYASSSRDQLREVQHLLLRFGILAKVRKKVVQDTASNCTALELQILEGEDAEIFTTEINMPSEQARLVAAQHSDVYWDRIVEIEPLGYQQVYDLTVDGTHNFIAEDICVHNTTLAMNMVEHAVISSDKPVMVFSMEMPAESLMLRMLSSLGRIDQTRVRTGQLEDEDWPRLTSAVNILKDKQLFIDDTAALSPNEMRSRIRRVVREHGNMALIMIDYLQLMQIPGFSENRTGEISEISRSLKGLAKEFGCPVVALSQLNRSLEQRPNKRPVMSDLRESGAIEQDADVIAFVYRDEVYNPDNPDNQGLAELIVGKQRNGPIGTVHMAFIGKYTRFEDLAPDSYGEAFGS
ncbi:replicative DNA helicase [Halomonas garicola]|uniref:replicative DNA helicase n=1 Tax=Halomonas garicola TaxID=1690008 RepID=UPI00289B0075|nr:replicative DNA helicase [Halomonas garicola]